MADVKFKGQSDFEKVKRDYEDLARRAAKVESENRKLAGTVNRAERQTQRHQSTMRRSFQQMKTQVSGAIAGFFSLEAAIRAVTAAIEEQRQKEDASLNATLKVAQADAQVVKNLVGQTAEVKKQTLDELKKISESVGVESEAQVKFGFSAAISKASGDRELALRATQAAARQNRLTPDAIAETAGGAVSVSRLAGVQDPRKALGFLADVQGRSPIVDPRLAIRVLPGTLAGVTGNDQRGGTEESVRAAGALFAALGTAAGDETGSPTGTASIQFSGQLREFFKGRDIDPGTLEGRIQTLQSDRQLQDEILANLVGEQRFKVPFEQIIRGQGLAADEFRANLPALSVSEGIKRFEKQARELESLTPALQHANANAAELGRIEALKSADQAGARTARVRRNLEETLKASGFTAASFASRKLSMAEFETELVKGTSPEEAAIESLKLREQAIRTGPLEFIANAGLPRSDVGRMTGLNPAFSQALGPVLRTLDPDGATRFKRDDQLSSEQLEAIKAIRDAIEQLNGELRSRREASGDTSHRAAALLEAHSARTE